ncbi:MAG TPA: efflux RND transporter periplasmic adaptor subunit [Hyphomicrobiaceae bacterium]|nr:efflux RND transporter periplasmic adaptor subunit [Hyphomicrobiaceae bacterium]
MIRLLKQVVAFSVVGGLAAAALYVSGTPSQDKPGGGNRRAGRLAGEGPVPVLAASARIADVPVYFYGVGTARARNTVTVRPQVDGRILSVNFKEGQEVKRGDLLAKIDPATYQAQLDQALAKKTLDQVQLANAQRDLERYDKLTALSVAPKTIDTQRALVGQLTAQLKADDAAIANAKAFLDYTSILAPIDGRTGIRMVDEGNLVRASDAGIVVITEVRPISVLFTLPQQQLKDINRALTAGSVSVEALESDGKTVLDHGSLQVIDNQVDQTTGTVRMKADFPNAQLQLWPGQFVNARVLVNTLSQVVVIPTPAVQRGPNGTFAYVITDDQRVAMRPITVALQNETQAVVGSGITASERVVTTGFVRLKDGSRVTIGEPEAAPPPNDAPTGASISTAVSPSPEAKGERPREHGKGKHRRENAEAGGKAGEADSGKREGNVTQ